MKGKDNIKYSAVSAIYINKAMNEQEESKITDILFSFNEVKQIYFVENVDFKTIEKIKYTVELSPAIKDETIEKIIFTNLSPEDEKSILKMRLKNPNSWFIAYEKKANNVSICKLNDYKEYLLYIKRLKEQVEGSNFQEVVDFLAIELDKFKQVDESLSIIEQINSKKIMNDSYLILMKRILKDLSYNSYIAKTKEEQYLMINVSNKYYFISRKNRKLKNINEIEGLLSPIKYLEEENIDYARRKYNLYLEKFADSLEEDLSKNFKDIYKEINS